MTNFQKKALNSTTLKKNLKVLEYPGRKYHVSDPFKLQASGSKLQSICSDRYVFFFFWKNFIFFVRTKFILGIWGMNGQYFWQILALVSFIQLIKFPYHFKTEKQCYFAVPISLDFWCSKPQAPSSKLQIFWTDRGTNVTFPTG